MIAEKTTILIMAAGTGGHVFPALSIAQKLQEKGVRTEWMGTKNGMENRLLKGTGITIHAVSAKGLKGKGVLRLLLAPLMLVVALIQSIKVIVRVKPNCVLGMGGFVSGPGGVAAKLMRKPLILHEQNAVPGFTNKILAMIADRVFEAFPNTFKVSGKVVHAGNPLRKEIVALAQSVSTKDNLTRPLRILVLGGSQGALANAWADIVICRSGASTVSELAAVGLPAILVPYPYHSDQQQTHNANWLVQTGAAFLLEQCDLSVTALSQLLVGLEENREELQRMSSAARSIAVCNADELIASYCMEVAHA